MTLLGNLLSGALISEKGTKLRPCATPGVVPRKLPRIMDMYQIEGARPLKGTLTVSGSKNACLPLMMAALLSDEPSIIDNVPDLRDIRSMIELLRHLGASVIYKNGRLGIDPNGFQQDTVPYEIMRKMRASFYAMGPMIARLGRAKVSDPGGCAIGPRPIDLHLRGFKALGVQFDLVSGYRHAILRDFKGTRVSLLGDNGTSVGATCNILMAAVLAKGESIIDDAAIEPEVIELGTFLKEMGAKIDGLGTHTLRIQGVKKLGGIHWEVRPDRIEATTYAIAALMTHGNVVLEKAPCLEDIAATLTALQTWGADLEWLDKTTLRVKRGEGKKRPLQLVTEPFPGLPTDIQSQLTALLAVTPGQSVIRETIYPDRFSHVPEMNRLGARIETSGRGRITINGMPALDGAAMMASDLRAGAALVCTALAAHGTSQVRRIYHVERGYENMEGKLRALGAHITRLEETAIDPGLNREAYV